VRRLLSFVGLGLVAGAVFHQSLHAQVPDSLKKRRDTTLVIPVPAHADSLLRDSLAKRDSMKAKAARDTVKRDTIKAPFTHAEAPNDVAIGARLHWDRAELFASGALTLADLLDRVPGLTTLGAGWIGAPAIGAYLGDVRRVRVFFDGLELAGLDPRGQSVLDLTQVNLWAAEDVVVEQAPEEVRVYIRTWRVQNTTPNTRTDVATGDQQTNLYRGFFGKRWDDGAGLQFGAQQYGTTPPSRFGSSSDQTGLIGRVGWARGDLSIDAFGTRITRHRGSVLGIDPTTFSDSIPGVGSSRTDAYLRVGYHDPDVSRLWAQVMAVGSKYDYVGIRTVPTTGLTTAAESALAVTPLDTSRYLTQYIASVGSVRGPLRVSATGRLFAEGGHYVATPSLRGSYSRGWLGLSAFIEGKNIDSISHSDVTAQVAPLPFISVLGGVGRSEDSRAADGNFSASYVRGEVGLRLHGLWFTGGMLRRDSVLLSPPHVFDTTFTPRVDGSAIGLTAGIRGHVWGPFHTDLSAIKWTDSSGYYRPLWQTRSELSLQTSLLQRFPTGAFGLKASIVHEYRSGVRFPRGAFGVVTTPGYRIYSTLVEIRILDATITWQFRNFLGEQYVQVPFFLMPRQTNIYGVRWQFFD
jgi:hypothetical protein